jgi:O-antigen ligase
LVFNPLSTKPVEAAKAGFLYALTLLMVVGWAAARMYASIRKGAPASGESAQAAPLWRRRLGRIFLLLIASYALIYAISTILSLDPNLSWWGSSTRQGTLTVFALLAVTAFTAMSVSNFERADNLITMMLIGSIPVAIYGYLQYFGFDPLIWRTTSISPVHATTGYSLYLGAYLAMVIPMTLGRVMGWKRGGGRSFPFSYLVILALQASCLLFTLSRGAALAALTGCLALALLAMRWRRRSTLALVAALALVVGGAALLLIRSGGVTRFQAERLRYSEEVISQLRSQSNQDRGTVWRLSLPLIPGGLWIGYGPETYPLTFEQYYGTSAYTLALAESAQSSELTAQSSPSTLSMTYWDPHNLALAQLLSVGVVGLVILGLIIGVVGYGLVRLARQEVDAGKRLTAAALAGAMAAYLVGAQLNPSGFVATAIFWLVVGAGAGLSKCRSGC